MSSVIATIGTTVDEVLALVDELDEITYGGMDLRTHAFRCAALAIDDGADDQLVAAALLHDIGRARYLARAAPGVPHEEVGRRFAETRFGDRVAWVIGKHVVAKRYLATVDDAYVDGLPRTSRSSLRRQGGTLSPKQVRAFESNPWAADAVTLRRWDDSALVTEVAPATPDGVAPHLAAAWAG